MDQEEQETNATDTGTGGMLLSEKETPVEVEEESLSKKLKESIPTLEDLKESASKIADDMTLESDDEELDEEEDKQKEVEREMKEEMEREADVLRRGRNRLEKMILRLEAELEEADQEIGSSLNLLDQNHDGICTTAELRNAYTKVLKEDDTSKADALIARVDPSSKGYFKIADLHGLLEDLEEDDTDSKIFEFLGGKGVREEDQIALTELLHGNYFHFDWCTRSYSEEYFIFKKDKKKQFTKYIEGVPHMCDASCTTCNFEAIVV